MSAESSRNVACIGCVLHVWYMTRVNLCVRHPEDQLVLEVYDEDMMGSDDFLGRMKIPLYRIVHGRANQPVRIRDQLQDRASKLCRL